MMKKNPALAGASSAPTVASNNNGPRLVAPQPKVPIIPATLSSQVVYAATPSPSAGVSSGSMGTPTSAAGTPSGADDLLRRVAEARKRVANAQTKLAVKDNPYMVRTPVFFLKTRIAKRYPATGRCTVRKAHQIIRCNTRRTNPTRSRAQNGRTPSPP